MGGPACVHTIKNETMRGRFIFLSLRQGREHDAGAVAKADAEAVALAHAVEDDLVAVLRPRYSVSRPARRQDSLVGRSRTFRNLRTSPLASGISFLPPQLSSIIEPYESGVYRGQAKCAVRQEGRETHGFARAVPAR